MNYNFNEPPKILFILFSVITIYIFFVFSVAKIHFKGNFSGFFYVAEKYKWDSLLPKGTYVRPAPNVGYDGQFYLYISQDPLILKSPKEKYKYIDSPSYRYQRIFYPLLAYLFSAGNRENLVWSFILINLLSILMGTLVVALMCKERGYSVSYSYFYAFIVGHLISTMRNLNEPVGSFFCILAFYFYFKKSFGKTSLAFSFSVMTKETFILMPIGLFLENIIKNILFNKYGEFAGNNGFKKLIKSNLYLAFPLVPLLLWQFYVFSRFGKFAYQESMGNIGLPFREIFKKLILLDGRIFSPNKETFEIMIFLTILMVFISLAIALFKKKVPIPGVISIYLIFVSTYGKAIWIDFWSFGRVTIELFIIAMISLIFSNDKIIKISFILNTILFFILLIGLILNIT